MARFCARIRQVAPLLQVAMRDIYAHTTVRRLAAALAAAKPAVETYAEAPAEAPSRLAYALTGAAQFAFYVVAGLLGVDALAAELRVHLRRRALAVRRLLDGRRSSSRPGSSVSTRSPSPRNGC